MSERPPTPDELRAKVRAVETAKRDSPEQMNALIALMDVEYTFRFAALVDRIEALADEVEGGGLTMLPALIAEMIRAALRKPLDTEDDDAREPSRLERVQAALPEGWEARAYGTNPQSRIWITWGSGPHGTYGYTYAEESTLAPEEAVEAVKKLAGVE